MSFKNIITCFIVGVLFIIIFSGCYGINQSITESVTGIDTPNGNAFQVKTDSSPDKSIDNLSQYMQRRDFKVSRLNSNTITTEPKSMSSTNALEGEKEQIIRMKAVAQSSDGGSEIVLVADYQAGATGDWKRAKVESAGELNSTGGQAFKKVRNFLRQAYGGENVDDTNTDLEFSEDQSRETGQSEQKQSSRDVPDNDGATQSRNSSQSMNSSLRRGSTVSHETSAQYSEVFPIDTQQEIAWVQQTLNLIGYECGPVDGVMGANTRSCIRTLQIANGLEETGAMNEVTYKWMVEQLDLTPPEEKSSESSKPTQFSKVRRQSEPRTQEQSTPQNQSQPRRQSSNQTQQNSELRGASEAPIQFNTTGLFTRGYISGNGLSGDGGSISGRGIGVKLGYGFNPSTTAYFGLSAANMEVGSLSYFDMGMQYNFIRASALVPYIDVALSGIGDDAGTSGVGITAGGGVKYFVSPVFAVDGGMLLNFSSIEGGESVTGARLNLGVAWFPFR